MDGAAGRALALAAVAAIALTACPLLFRDETVAGSDLALRITIADPVGAQGIAAESIAVTRVDIDVTGAGFSFDETWVPADGTAHYDVSLPGAGSYTVQATHHGVSAAGDAIAATEDATLYVEPLIISVMTIVPGQILAVKVIGDYGIGRFGVARFDAALFGP